MLPSLAQFEPWGKRRQWRWHPDVVHIWFRRLSPLPPSQLTSAGCFSEHQPPSEKMELGFVGRLWISLPQPLSPIVRESETD